MSDAFEDVVLIIGFFGDDLLDMTVEALTVLGCQVFCGQYHYRNFTPFFISLQCCDDLKAVHLGHHEVEQDEVGLILGEPIEGNKTIVGGNNLPAGDFEGARQKVAGIFIIFDNEDCAW